MISIYDKEEIISLAKKYGATRVLLFGSSATSRTECNDIDLAVDGIKPTEFFAFYGDLMLHVSKPVDLIDLSGTSRFHKMVAAEGIPIYG
jgi:predicted nucleotidyltransferase